MNVISGRLRYLIIRQGHQVAVHCRYAGPKATEALRVQLGRFIGLSKYYDTPTLDQHGCLPPATTDDQVCFSR